MSHIIYTLSAIACNVLKLYSAKGSQKYSNTFGSYTSFLKDYSISLHVIGPIKISWQIERNIGKNLEMLWNFFVVTGYC